jgi:thioredoxin-related protein
VNRRRAAGLLLLGALASAHAAGAPALQLLSNWQADSRAAAQGGRPLVLFFTLPGCRFCDDVRQRYMLPLAREGELVREVVIDSDRPVAGMPGAATQRALARKLGARVAPVVLLVDARGEPLADAIVGGDVAGLYGGYLENAFAAARASLARRGARAGEAREPAALTR